MIKKLCSISFTSTTVKGYKIIKVRKTQVIAASAVVRLLVVFAAGSITLFAPNLNGAAVGVAAIGCAFLSEVLILGWCVKLHSRSAGPIFPQET